MELHKSRTSTKTEHSPATSRLMDGDRQVGWMWWSGGNNGRYVVAGMDGAELVPVDAGAKTVGRALELAAAVLAPPPPPPPPPAPVVDQEPPQPRPRKAAPVPGRRQLVRPAAPVVPRTAGVRRERIEVSVHEHERKWLQAEANRETGGNLAELIRQRVLRGMPPR